MTDYAELIEELERPVPKGGKCSHGYIRPLFSEREGIVRKKAATALETTTAEVARLTAENARLRSFLETLQHKCGDGSICDDVAWFDQITTLWEAISLELERDARQIEALGEPND